jgi:Tol biopolymer transport system component/DNA-binding winged helix-turn-helix (wHTH) protein
MPRPIDKPERASGANSHRVAFDRFEMDLRSGELRKDGRRIKLQAQPFQLLALLIENAGAMVTRVEVSHALWRTDTFVDFDHSVAAAVNKIREALGDSAENPRFIETLPKRGYRFIGKIAVPAPTLAPGVLKPPSRVKFPLGWLLIGAGTISSLLAVIAVMVIHGRSHSQPLMTTITPVPFTALPGNEVTPAFSPDGSRIAFSWDGDPGSGKKGSDLYVKAIGSETLLKLTQHPSEWISPAWSPDGTQIAFHRMDGADTGIYVVPAMGGTERKLRSTRIPYSVAAPISWSPDGKLIALTDTLPNEHYDLIFLLSLDTLETRQLPHNPKCAIAEGEAAFSHDGSLLAYVCVRSLDEMGIYTVPVSGGTPRVITVFRNFILGLAWSADDKKLFVSRSLATSNELEEVSVADGLVRQVPLGQSAEWPTVSAAGNKLAFSSSTANSNIWRRDLLNPKAAAVKLISTTREETAPQYSPDGNHIAFESSRGGGQDVWISEANGSNPVQVSNFHAFSGSPHWSPDGKKIAFDSHVSGQWEVFVADVSERVPRRLVTSVSNVYQPSWSRDGRWIYFRSDQGSKAGLYRCPATGGDAATLTVDVGATYAQESADGQSIFFASRMVRPQLKMLSLFPQPGPELEVEGLPPLIAFNFWSLDTRGIYFVGVDAPKSVRYFDLATRRLRPVFSVEKNFSSGFSVSPDGRWLLYSQVDEANSDIMLVENFH